MQKMEEIKKLQTTSLLQYSDGSVLNIFALLFFSVIGATGHISKYICTPVFSAIGATGHISISGFLNKSPVKIDSTVGLHNKTASENAFFTGGFLY
jgi:hypothetical protein